MKIWLNFYPHGITAHPTKTSAEKHTTRNRLRCVEVEVPDEPLNIGDRVLVGITGQAMIILAIHEDKAWCLRDNKIAGTYNLADLVKC